MSTHTKPSHSLPDEARRLVWRIFGEGESLLTNRTSYGLVKPITNKRASDTNKHRIGSEICSWFEKHQDDLYYLREEKIEVVTDLILEGIREERGDTAIWAISWTDPERVIRHTLSNWDPGEIESFVEAIISVLKDCCDQDRVLDAARFLSLETLEKIDNLKVPKASIAGNGLLKTYLNVHRNLRFRLHRPFIHLVEIVIRLRPGKFESFVERVDHPVVRYWATHFMMTESQNGDHRKPLRWIKEGACDDLIALSIVHTLDTVNRIDTDLVSMERLPLEKIRWRTELRPPRDNLDAAAAKLITDLVTYLKSLDPSPFARWIGEILVYATSVFHSQNNSEVPHRIEQLEQVCIASLAQSGKQRLLDNLLAEFRAGLSLSIGTSWTRHIARLASSIRDVAPMDAAKISQEVLEINEQHIAKRLRNGGLYWNWSQWDDRAWIEGVSTALALSQEKLDLLHWVTEKCQALPLSVWEAEENFEEFCAAHKAALHWFLVALGTVQIRKRLGHAVDPIEVCTLAEALWAHCHFVGMYVPSAPELSDEVEFAALIVAESGAPSDTWLLKQVRDFKLGSRALRALVDQRILKREREGVTHIHAEYDEEIMTGVARLAAEHFGEGVQFSFGTLSWWAQLWLSLSMSRQAEYAARAMLRFPRDFFDRRDMLVLLKLLALVFSMKGKLDPLLADHPTWLYTKVWPDSYTPEEEQDERKQIEESLMR